MTKKINILLLALLIDIFAFGYLSYHHYEVKTGIGGDSICSISSKLNCDAAAMSSYSEVFNIPVAILGAFFHLVLFSILLFYKLGWAENSPYLRTTIRTQLVVSALVSVIMAGISWFIIHVTCPFCALTYVLSLINLGLGWNVIAVDSKNLSFDISGYFGEYKSHLYGLLFIPIASWIVSGMVSSHFRLDELRRYVPEKIAIWKSSQQMNFDNSLGISNKVENARHVIVEFADFKCPHCRDASKSLSRFLSAHSDVQFVYKPFPLDGICNPAITAKGDGSRCTFAAIALCAEKLNSKGLEVTHWLFENQEKFFEIADGKSILPQAQSAFNLDATALASCVDSAEIYEQIKKSSEEGSRAGVEGTPTIFVDGRKLPWGHIPEVLSQAVQ